MVMRFRIRSALAIIAVYCVLSAVMRPLGMPGIVASIVSGTAISSVIILARRKDLIAILGVTIGALMGAVLGFCCLSPMILSQVYQYDHGFGETAKSNMMGVVVGTLVGSFVALLIMLPKSSPLDPHK